MLFIVSASIANEKSFSFGFVYKEKVEKSSLIGSKKLLLPAVGAIGIGFLFAFFKKDAYEAEGSGVSVLEGINKKNKNAGRGFEKFKSSIFRRFLRWLKVVERKIGIFEVLIKGFFDGFAGAMKDESLKEVGCRLRVKPKLGQLNKKIKCFEEKKDNIWFDRLSKDEPKKLEDYKWEFKYYSKKLLF